MQYSIAAVAALVASVAAQGYTNGTGVVYTTEVHTAYTTYCPAPTHLTYNGVTYTVTEATTLTITDCPCTVVTPVTTTAPAPSAPVYHNATTAYPTTTKVSVGTTAVVVPTGAASPSPIEANSGNKAFAMSGASLAGVLGLAAYFL